MPNTKTSGTFRSKLAKGHALREASDSLPAESAPYTNSELFKLPSEPRYPKAQRWSHLLSVDSRARTASTLKAASTNTAKLIRLGTARPSPQFYPWIATTAEVSKPDNDGSMSVSSRTRANDNEIQELGVSLNYGFAARSPSLVRFFTEHINMIHNPPYKDWETCLTNSTTSALEIVFRIFCNRGDSILMKEKTYSGALEGAHALGLQVQGVSMDEYGLRADVLDETLTTWNISRGPKPSILYTIPSGQDPTSISQPANRRREVYQIAEKHDLYIIEDDPYYLLQMARPCGAGPEEPISVDDYVASLPPSYLSLDVSGRVARLETTSKILAPGLRFGWLTASSQIVGKFLNYVEFSTVAPAGLSQ